MAKADDQCAAACAARLSDTAPQLAKIVVEVSVMAVDWLANFSNYNLTTKLRQSYRVAKSSFKFRI